MYRKKSLWYSMRNFNKLKYIFIILGTNHPETALIVTSSKMLFSLKLG